MLSLVLGNAGDNKVTMTELVPPLTAIPVYQSLDNHKLLCNNGDMHHKGGAQGASYKRGICSWDGEI